MKKRMTLIMLLFATCGMLFSTPADRKVLPEHITQKLTTVMDQAGHAQHADRGVEFITRAINHPGASQQTEKITTSAYMNEVVHFYWANNQWVEEYKENHHYNANDPLTVTYQWEWINNQWVYAAMMTYSYDTQGHMVQMEMKTWDEPTGTWEDFMRMNITNNAQGNPVEVVIEVYFMGSWRSIARIVMTYNAQDQIIELLSQEYDMLDSVWVDGWRELMTYDANNLMIEVLEQEWIAGTWEDVYKDLISYDAGGLRTEVISQTWIGAWENYARETYTYNAEDVLIHILEEWWDGAAWEDDYFYTMTYDVQSRLHEQILQEWMGGSWENLERELWTYDLPVGVATPSVRTAELVVYPNPATHAATLALELNQTTNVTITMYDLSGRMMVQRHEGVMPEGKHQMMIPVSDLPQGYYLITVRDGNHLLARERVMVVR